MKQLLAKLLTKTAKKPEISQKPASGVAIQAFGRYLAGIMDMRMYDNYKIYEDYAEEPYKITGVSPFSIIGIADPYLQNYAAAKRTNTRVKADIRKNFDLICRKAYCDYFILDNTSALIGLTEINTQFYSLMGGEKTDFMDDYYNKNPEIKAGYIRPQEEGFSKRLKNQYDKFIDTILQHYDNNRIILVRANVPLFYFNAKTKKVDRTKHTASTRQFIAQLDDYFIKKANCHVLHTAVDLPNVSQWDLKVALERDTISLIEGNYTGVATNSAAGQFSDYIANGGKDAQIISKMLTSQKTFLGYDDILALFWLHDVELPNVIKGENSTETEIAEAANLLNVLIETIPTLAKTINTPNHTKTLFHKNLETLHNYQYNSINLHNITYSKKVLIPLSNHHFLEFSENGLFIFDNLPKPKWDYKQFVENGYICGVRQIHSALESWETYFERGRRKSSEPFILQFANMGEFENSLYFLDYADILDNENYIVSLKNQHLPAFADYLPKVDAAFLFAENTRVFTTFNGLIDQLTGLCNALNICEKNNLELYINDFMFDDYPVFESFQADKIMSAPINSRRFSKMFSRRLRWRIVNFRMFHKQPAIFIISAAEKLFYLGLQELYSVVFYDLRFVQKRRYPPIFERLNLNPEFIVICCLNLEQCNNLTINKIPQKPLIISALPAGTSRKTFEGRTEYPTMSATDTNNHKIAQLAKSHDLIAIHLRRGDHMIGSHYSKSKDSLDYKIGIDLLHNHEYFTKFKNKHLLVFSDDMDWTKKHAEQFAFQTFGENLTYVDWNRHFDSYKDMQLMSMCKVIIRGIGRFAATAFVLSTTSEFLIECRELQITDSSGKITKLQEDF